VDDFLRITNYEKYQHYADRNPVWVKQHRSFWNNSTISLQKTSTRLLALFLISYASEYENGLIPDSVTEISRRSNLNKAQVQYGLESLISSGFLERAASTGLANGYKKAKPLDKRDIEIEKNPPVVPPGDDDVRKVFDHWLKARAKPSRTRLTDNRRRRIKARLKTFSADELTQALDAVALDPWEERARHDDLTQLFRNDEHVEKWLSLKDNPPPQSFSAADLRRMAS
jgi:hypothetical protein